METPAPHSAPEQEHLTFHRSLIAEEVAKDLEHPRSQENPYPAIGGAIRVLLDMMHNNTPSYVLTRRFLNLLLAFPPEHRVDFVNALSGYLGYKNSDALHPADREKVAKRLHTISNKVAGLLYDLTILIAEYRLKDPGKRPQLTFFPLDGASHSEEDLSMMEA